MRQQKISFIESMESRRHLSATLSDSGVLTVTGSRRNDHIAVTQTETQLVVTSGRKAAATRETFDLSAVNSIVISSGRGNDAIDTSSVTVPVTFYCGDGDDNVVGGNGRDDILGGAGDDTLFSGGGRDSISGDDGDDAIAGGGSNDSLSGGTGDDSLDGGNGDDSLAGDDGADRCNGGNGDDNLRGGGGRDRFAGGVGHDLFDDFSSKDRGRDDDPLDDNLDDSTDDNGGATPGNDDPAGHQDTGDDTNHQAGNDDAGRLDNA